jgi:beta-lactamase class A
MAQQRSGHSDTQRLTLVALVAFLVGAVLSGAVVAILYSSMPSNALTPIRESNIQPDSGYQFTDPLIGFQSANIEAPEYDTLEQQVESFVSQQQSSGLISASVYFRDINQSKGFTTNPTATYYPASLYKVPIMMAYYELAEINPSILSQSLVYSGTTNLNDAEEIRSSVQLRPEAPYTVEELIEHMIRYSDNNAAELLLTNLSATNHYQDYLNLYASLGVSTSTVDEASDSLTVGKYPIFLRALYNATYLDRDYSEQALKLLTETDFTEGIDSGVPNGVLVAQKFGETTISNGSVDTGKELSNCGIIYYPSHPYLLCIMTKGSGDNIKGLEEDIASISRLVYQNMETLYPSN